MKAADKGDSMCEGMFSKREREAFQEWTDQYFGRIKGEWVWHREMKTREPEAAKT